MHASSMTLATQIPASLRAGDTWTWQVSLPPPSERANQLENIWFAGDNIICLASCRIGIGIMETERLGAHHAAP